MTSPIGYECPLGVPTESLSAWRDGLLDQREAAQLSAHVYDCPACQERLATFDRLGATLRSSSAPDLRETVWAGLRARILRGGSGKPGGSRALLGGGLATVAAALLVVLFLALFSGHNNPTTPGSSSPTVRATPPSATATGIPTDGPTATPNGGAWTNAFASTGFSGQILAFAPSNPQTAYVCAPVQSGELTLQVSTQGGVI